MCKEEEVAERPAEEIKQIQWPAGRPPRQIAEDDLAPLWRDEGGEGGGA